MSPRFSLNRRRRRVVTSRLAKKEQKKLTYQTYFYILLTIGLLAGFVLFIMPNAIRLFFHFIGTGLSGEVEDSIPPQVPIISSPVSATHSATLALSGYGEPNSEVVFILDSEELDRIMVDDEGNFEYDVPLVSGENELVVFGVDQAGNESIKTKSYKILFDNEPPVLEFDNLEDEMKIELKKNQTLVISGQTEPNTKITINGRLTTSRQDGSFSLNYFLNEGENKLEIIAEDKAGNITTQEKIVNFQP